MKIRNILITGASSGIGQALAIYYAQQKNVENLFICGRNKERLNEVKQRCQEIGKVKIYASVIDVSDREGMKKWINGAEKESGWLNLVFANAGISISQETPEQVYKIFDINLIWILNTILPIIEIYKKRRDKDKIIVMTSSMAWYHWLPTCPSYSATKAWIKAYGEALRIQLLPYNIQVNTICPGFVRSRMTDKCKYVMPFFMETENAAKLIARRIERNVWLIAFPFPIRFVSWFVDILPNCISDSIYKHLPYIE